MPGCHHADRRYTKSELYHIFFLSPLQAWLRRHKIASCIFLDIFHLHPSFCILVKETKKSFVPIVRRRKTCHLTRYHSSSYPIKDMRSDRTRGHYGSDSSCMITVRGRPRLLRQAESLPCSAGYSKVSSDRPIGCFTPTNSSLDLGAVLLVLFHVFRIYFIHCNALFMANQEALLTS